MGRGKLKFKGEEKAKKKKSSTKKKAGGSHSNANATGEDVVAAASNISGSTQLPNDNAHASSAVARSVTGNQRIESSEKSEDQGPKISIGRGSITTSGTVVSGHGSAFKTELRVGDAILARTKKGADEMRVITMVLSQISISISSAFSSDFSTPAPYSYINKPRDDKREKAIKVEKARQEKEAVEERAMGTYGNKGEIIYREKTAQGGYRIRKEKATTDMSRSDLLGVRAKKKSDRYC